MDGFSGLDSDCPLSGAWRDISCMLSSVSLLGALQRYTTDNPHSGGFSSPSLSGFGLRAGSPSLGRGSTSTSASPNVQNSSQGGVQKSFERVRKEAEEVLLAMLGRATCLLQRTTRTIALEWSGGGGGGGGGEWSDRRRHHAISLPNSNSNSSPITIQGGLRGHAMGDEGTFSTFSSGLLGSDPWVLQDLALSVEEALSSMQALWTNTVTICRHSAVAGGSSGSSSSSSGRSGSSIASRLASPLHIVTTVNLY